MCGELCLTGGQPQEGSGRFPGNPGAKAGCCHLEGPGTGLLRAVEVGSGPWEGRPGANTAVGSRAQQLCGAAGCVLMATSVSDGMHGQGRGAAVGLGRTGPFGDRGLYREFDTRGSGGSRNHQKGEGLYLLPRAAVKFPQTPSW